MVVHEGRVGGFLDSGEIKNIVPQKQATQENVMILATGGTL